MAFTSKVVILLLVLSLGWWQASAEGGSAKTIIENLNNLTMITNALGTKVSATNFTKLNLIEGFQHLAHLLKGYKDIVNAFVLVKDRLKMVSDPISDGATVVKAVEILEAAQEKLAEATAKIFSRFKKAPPLLKIVSGDLLKLRMAAQEYGENLEKLLLMTSQRDAAGELFRKLGSVLLDAAKKLMPKK